MSDVIKTVIPGYDAACSINGVMFGIKKRKITAKAETADVTDTEDQDPVTGIIYIKERSGRRQAIVGFDFYEDKKVFPWAGPLNLKGGNVVEVKCWRSFATDAPWVFPRLVLRMYEETQRIEGYLEGSLLGVTDGPFKFPDEA